MIPKVRENEDEGDRGREDGWRLETGMEAALPLPLCS